MKANRDFVRRIGFLFRLGANVAKKLAKSGWDAPGRHIVDVFVGLAKLPGPGPNVPEHAPMKPTQEIFVEHVALAGEGPAITFGIAGLVHGVQFAADGEMGRDQAFPLFRREGRAASSARPMSGSLKARPRGDGDLP